MKKFLREYRLEILALLLAALGIFLLTENLQIRQTFRRWLYHQSENLKHWGGETWQSLGEFARNTTISDLLGYLILLLALLFIAWRVRYRVLHSRRWLIHGCPRCGSPVRRVHRRLLERLVSKLFILRAHRFRCTNPECGWSGLRGHAHSHHHAPPPEITEAE